MDNKRKVATIGILLDDLDLFNQKTSLSYNPFIFDPSNMTKEKLNESVNRFMRLNDSTEYIKNPIKIEI